MRRQDIQLLVAARHGDTEARCQVGRRYILGTDGFARHIATGLDYLTHPSVADHPAALAAIAQGLTLEEALTWDQLPALARAAEQGIASAAVALAAWELMAPQTAARGMERLRKSVAADDFGATCPTCTAGTWAAHATDAASTLTTLAANGLVLSARVFVHALRRANDNKDLDGATWALLVGQSWLETDWASVAANVVDTVCLAEKTGGALGGLDSGFIERAIEQCTNQGDPRALYLQGRALAGLHCGALEPQALVRTGNVRKGAALLLRAADAGNVDAWMHLYRLSSDRQRTVANPQMARFFLEKAAQLGDRCAQRILGALLLRESEGVQGSERALHWLHLADKQGDPLARKLMSSLVLPVAGDESAAQNVVAAIGKSDPLLAARLAVARCLGLTRLEALGVDLVSGSRPWGLVVGPNPAVRQPRLAAARAVPALSEESVRTLHRAATLHAGQSSIPLAEGSLHQRSRSLRALLQRFGANDTSFFAAANSTTLDSLRIGAKWAYRAKDVLRSALADCR